MVYCTHFLSHTFRIICEIGQTARSVHTPFPVHALNGDLMFQIENVASRNIIAFVKDTNFYNSI